MNTYLINARPWIALLGIALSSTCNSETLRLRDGTRIPGAVAGYDNHRVILNQNGRFIEVPFARLAEGSRETARRILDGESPSRDTDETPHRDVPSTSGRGVKRIVNTTAYSHHEADHQPYGVRNALGTMLRFEGGIRSAAADWSVFPVGTTFKITGQPWTYVVDDYGSALVGTSTIDLYQPNLVAMKNWGRRNVEVTILRWGSFQSSARILAKRTRHAHCRAMHTAIMRKISRR